MGKKIVRKKELKKGQSAGLNALLSKGRIFWDMPALADRGSIPLRDTGLESSLICQPQHRNIHGRIFGGFLMHRAYGLAFSTALAFAGTVPYFLEVDHVDFLKPLDNSDRPLISVDVITHVSRPEIRTRKVSNNFYFTFTFHPEAKATNHGFRIRSVVPATKEEAHRILGSHGS